MFAFYGVTSGTVIAVQGGETSDPYVRSARVSVSKTLDGNSVFLHSGFNAADTDIKIVLSNLSNAQNELLQTIMETDVFVYMSCFYGFFSGAFSNMSIKNGKTNITFAIKEQIQ